MRVYPRSGLIALIALVALGCSDDGGVTPLTPEPGDQVTLLLITADLGPRFQSVNVWRGDDAVTDAVVTVNGLPVPHSGGGGGYSVQRALAAGSPVLEVSVGGVTVQGTGDVPETPLLTAPGPGTVFALADPMTITWTSVADPDRFEILAERDLCCPDLPTAPGAARELTIDAGDIGAGEWRIAVRAVNEGSFTGPTDPDSRIRVYSESSGEAGITITP